MTKEACALYMLAIDIYFICFSSQSGFPSNRGREFVFAFSEHYSTSNEDLFFTVINTNSFDVSIQAVSPGVTSNGVSESTTLSAYNYLKVDVDSDKLELSGSAVESKGIHVTSSDNVVVLGFNRKKWSNDAFIVTPSNRIGTEYTAITHCENSALCQIVVVATQDTSVVQITIPDSGNTINIEFGGKEYRNGDTIVVSLNQFETLQIQSKNDLTGLYISVNYPVSAFSGATRSAVLDGNHVEHFVDTLVPNEYLGREYIIYASYGNRNPVRDYVKITSVHDNTTVKIVGDTFCTEKTFTTKGNWAGHTMITEYLYIYSNHPVIVAQFVINRDGDGSIIFATPLEQFDSEYFFFAPGSFKNGWSSFEYVNYLIMIVRYNDTGGILLDGLNVPTSTIWTRIGNTSYVTTTLTVAGEKAHYVRHSENKTFGGYLYGEGDMENFAISLGWRFVPTSLTCQGTLQTNCTTISDQDLFCKLPISSTNLPSSDMLDPSTPSLEDTFESTSSSILMSLSSTSSEITTSENVQSSRVTTSVSSTMVQSSSTTSSSEFCSCPCSSSSSTDSPYYGLGLSESLEKIKEELTIDKKTTSAAIRKKISAPDERVSATTTGAAGVVIIIVVFGGLIVLDLTTLKRELKILIRNLRLRNT